MLQISQRLSDRDTSILKVSKELIKAEVIGYASLKRDAEELNDRVVDLHDRTTKDLESMKIQPDLINQLIENEQVS